tara:strand:- start:32 stop:355 length:324 start_codon:yes stop_codon:yes gene_type:complete
MQVVHNGSQVRRPDRHSRTQIAHREAGWYAMQNTQDIELGHRQAERREFLDVRPINFTLRPVQQKHQCERDRLEFRELDGTTTDLLVDVQIGSLLRGHLQSVRELPT